MIKMADGIPRIPPTWPPENAGNRRVRPRRARWPSPPSVRRRSANMFGGRPHIDEPMPATAWPPAGIRGKLANLTFADLQMPMESQLAAKNMFANRGHELGKLANLIRASGA